MLFQSYVSDEVKKQRHKKRRFGKCEFDKYLEGMRLRPIYFISRSTVFPLENSRHIFLGEAYVVRWAIGKFRNYLWGSEFTVLSDFSGLKKYLNQRLMYLTGYTGSEPNYCSTNL